MILKKLRKEKKYSQMELASMLGVSRSTVAMWESGASRPDAALLMKIAEIFDTTVDIVLGRAEPTSEKPGSSKGSVRIPVYGETAAGIPILAIENYDSDDPDDWEDISAEMARSGEYIALRIRGDSMEPRMKTGDVVIVRLQPDVETGDTAVVRIGSDEATCKKIKKTRDGIMLISTNPSYEPMLFSNKEITALPVSIIGKVVELRAKF